MKKAHVSLMVILFAGLFVCPGCNGDNGGTPDADADVRDLPVEIDITVDPDIQLDSDLELEVTPDLPSEETTGCNPLLGGACNLVDNCNCASGQACRTAISPGDPCDTIVEQCAGAGTVPTGETCTYDNDCAAGNACLTSPVWGTKCIRWCDDDTDCDAGHSCNIPVGMPGSLLGEGCEDFDFPAGYKACDLGCPANANCDPITGTPCADPNTACHYEFDCKIMYCAQPGTHAIGEDCGDGAGCVIGSDCLSQDSGATNWCAEFCNDSHACPTGKTCQTFNYDGDLTFGACTPLP
jgi:hypothetical protein